MAKKPSYQGHLLKGSKNKGTYFWLRRSFSFLVALALANWAFAHMGTIGAVVVFLVVIVVLYVFISHYVALALMAIENILS